MQVLYQIPQNSLGKSNIQSSTPQIVVQTPEGQNVNIPANHLSQGTQFLVPQNLTTVSTTNVTTYMVMSKENSNVQNVHIPITANNSMHIKHVPQNHISSPPSGVTQMIANISKGSLINDIDDPQRLNKTSITIVKGGSMSNNQKILVKKSDPILNRDNQKRPSNISINNPLNKNSNFVDGNQPMHYPKIQYVKNVNENISSNHEQQHKRPAVQTGGDKNQQKHVHKVHHGNARVKYVEFKPLGNQDNYKTQAKQTIYYPTHLPNNQTNPNIGNNQAHLTIHTPGNNQNIPQKSPPALRPPPPVPSRSLALNSPPSLVASPEIMPRFNFAGSPANINLSSHGSPHPMIRGNIPQNIKPLDNSVKPNRIAVTYQGLPQNQNLKPGEGLPYNDQQDNRSKPAVVSTPGKIVLF